MGRRRLQGACCTLAVLVCAVVMVAAVEPADTAAGSSDTFEVPLLMHNVKVEGENVYMATNTKLPADTAHVVRFEPRADMKTVHHMLLFLCPGEPLVRVIHGTCCFQIK